MRILFISLYFSIFLVGCGTKGPLYIPEQQYPQETPASN
ncbi:MAG: lipoprotein [Methylotenera sp.]|nr:lipoprotein [Methylotenera sp.]